MGSSGSNANKSTNETACEIFTKTVSLTESTLEYLASSKRDIISPVKIGCSDHKLKSTRPEATHEFCSKTVPFFDTAYEYIKPSCENHSAPSVPLVRRPGNEVELEIEMDHIHEKLTTKFDGKRYKIYFLDLYNEEYESFQQIYNGSCKKVSIFVHRKHISIAGDNLSVRRITEPQNTQSLAHEKVLEACDTESISFSTEPPFIAKYMDKYYLGGGVLWDEYNDLLHRTGYPMGTPIRIRRDRIVVDDKKHYINVLKRDVAFEQDQTVFIVKAFIDTQSSWIRTMDLRENRLIPKRYIVLYNLIEIKKSLIYSRNEGEFDEIYAEGDYSVPNETVVQKHDFLTSFDRERPLKMQSLPFFPLDKHLKEVMNRTVPLKLKSRQAQELMNFIRTYRTLDVKTRLNTQNYNKILNMMVQMEDEDDRLLAESFNQINCNIILEKEFIYYIHLNMDNDMFQIFDAAISNKIIFTVMMRPMAAFSKGISLLFAPGSEDKTRRPSATRGKVLRVSDGKLYFEMENRLKRVGEDYLYFIEFIHTRSPYQMCQSALEYVEQRKLHRFLFPQKPFGSPIAKDNTEVSWIDKRVNSEQMTAIRSIVNKTSDPYPFMLFGPPGTGKTKTLVEAIAQIVTTTSSNVLVCATSNAACDVLATRLLSAVPDAFIYRMYSHMAMTATAPDDVKSASNVSDGDAYYPSIDSLIGVQVLICTLTVAGRLSQAQISFKYPGHFSYVFIDECASASEATAIIPIAGVCSTTNAITASVILAGDPKQLRPIITSNMADSMGHGISLMERLMYQDPYLKNSATLEYNNRYIVQLTKNYRSHPAILFPSNNLFYEGALSAKAHTSSIDWYIGTKFLPSPQFPIIFRSVQGRCSRGDMTSLYNREEITQVIAYARILLDESDQRADISNNNCVLRKITTADIGIISPYKRQCRTLVSHCKENGWDDIKVGSVEIFQGQEKPIIIVSTVRSQMATVGFLNNWRRLNVLMTRAKCLLIIVGDPFTLSLDENWTYVLKYLQSNNAIIQSKRKFFI